MNGLLVIGQGVYEKAKDAFFSRWSRKWNK